jgi:hypothetical protein
MTATAKLSSTERRLRLRHRDDFLYYAPRCLKIRTKRGEVRPFRLNSAQIFLHQALEAQLANTGQIRALVLKGRQQGCSTYVEARFFWKVTHRRGVRAFIMTHVDDASANLFSMARRFYDHCPEPLRPSSSIANAREVYFNKLESGYRVGTAGSRGAARSDTIQFFHGSEVAYWPNAQTHVAGALQAVPDAPGSEVILESTSAGSNGLFYGMVQDALAGNSAFQVIFLPWFWQPEYRRPVPRDFVLSSEELQFADTYQLDSRQMAWRRHKIRELGGPHHFRREYPANPAEAFLSEVKGALWTRAIVDAARTNRVPSLVRIIIAIDPSGGGGAGHDEAGIIVAGISADQCFFVLADLSGRLSPAAWAQRAVQAFYHHKADRIVAERNFGGDMVGELLRQVDGDIPVTLVNASRGKQIRAEPVAALYEQKRVFHAGIFEALEDELTTWTPTHRRSPNRLDALVWAISALMTNQSAGLSFG